MNERLEAIVSGRVQMVMYRDFTQRKASGLKLTGEVRNLSNGTVYVIAEGKRDSLEKLVQKLFKGSLFSHVESVEVTWLPAKNEFVTFTLITNSARVQE